MDGENKGKPYEQMDENRGYTPIFGSTPIYFEGFFVCVFSEYNKVSLYNEFMKNK